ncbi:MAG: hypothetical protein IT181_13235 [Acidobacteria bacterium]|nr:hypothetical protein [Acidobacteriota bacterium]
MNEQVILFLGGGVMSGLVAYFTAQIVSERRLSTLEASMTALGQTIEGLRDELRTYYARKP